jgi:alpha-glucosidase
MVLFCSCQKTPKTNVTSPDGKIALAFSLQKEATLAYEVNVNEKPFITTSNLGFFAQEDINLSRHFHIEKVDFSSKDETWTQPWGENKEIRNHYNEMAVTLNDSLRTTLVMRFRLFNDGIGFRYEYQVNDVPQINILKELTAFNMVGATTSWSTPANFDSYEQDYRVLPLSEVKDANTPLTFKTKDSLYVSIHEAALTNFAGMTLKSLSPNHLQANLVPLPNGVKVHLEGGKFVTPWRTLQIGNKAVDLINSGLILNLNEPCQLETTDWIRPMKYVGVWWGMHLGIQSWTMDERHGATTKNAKSYIDFAHKNNFQAVLYEGWNDGWESWGCSQEFDFTKPYADFDIAEIARYAKERNIEIIGHHETGGNIPSYEKQLEKAMKWYTSYGIHAVKTGYAGGIKDGYKHHSQYMVNHYRKVVTTAAKYKVMLDAHEPIKPTGIRRTYPNMMTREGAKGMEWNAWSKGNSPEYLEILPFTRLLAGPMDYTPGTFDIQFLNTKHLPQRREWNGLDEGNSRVHTTLAKQLANFVIFYSPLQMASDLIENYEGHPAFQFFRDYNADCDWSKALQGEPGEFIAVVRRAGEDFFFGASTNEQARQIKVPLTFLKKGVTYRAKIYSDAADTDWKTNPTAYKISEKLFTSECTLTVVMASGGGQAVSFIPEK